MPNSNMADTASDLEDKIETIREPVAAQVSSDDQERGSIRQTIQRFISSGGDDDGKGELQKLQSERSVVRRTNTFTLSQMSAAEVTDLMQNTIFKESYVQMLKPYVPLILWLGWVLSGAAFYSLHDEFGWAKGLLMSVNVGWSIAWTTPGESPPSPYTSTLSKVVSLVHTTIGAIFLALAALFMARDLLDNKDSWIVMSSKRDEDEHRLINQKSLWDDIHVTCRYYYSKLRVAKWSIVWIVFGCLWYSYAHDFHDFFEVADFIVSTLCGGGYISLRPNSSDFQYTVTALFAMIGIPLFRISLGLLLSLILKKPEDKLIYEKMVAPVTSREQEFMEAFGIDDGDGWLDYKEYVILMAVRIGSVSPHLVKEIQDRFSMLDRKHCGEIPYSDLILPPKRMTRSERIQNFVGSSMQSMGDSFRERISKSFDGSDPTNLIPMYVPGAGASPPPSDIKKVLPFEGLEGDNNDIVVPYCGNPTSTVKVAPLPQTLEGEGGEEKERDVVKNDKTLRCSASVESLEMLELPPENRRVCDEEGEEDNDSICSIATFDGNNVEEGVVGGSCQVRLRSDELSVLLPHKDDDRTCVLSDTPSSQNKEGEEEEEEEEEGEEEEHFNANEGLHEITRLGSFKLPRPRRKSKRGTFRATMSLGSNAGASSDSVGGGVPEKLTPRQKEFFDEQEKLRAAQLHVERKNNMSGMLYFLHHQLLPHSPALAAWALWLMAGAVFYTIHEGVSVSKGLYMSTSIGYGIFWIELRGDPVSNVYTTFHFLIGIGVIAGAMSLLAQYLLSQDKNWYSDAMKAKKLEEALATDGVLDDVFALAQYYWPHLKVHCFFFFFVIIGTLFASLSFDHWGCVDCLYFALSTMTTGGFVHIPNDSPDWSYLFVCIYVAIGVPIMSISCGILSHQITSKGNVQLKVDKVNAQVTAEEVEKMKWYGIEDGSGAVDSKEYVILILVRIGAISPEVISVLQDRFDQLDTEKVGEIAYEVLMVEEGEGSQQAHRVPQEDPLPPV